MVAGASSVMGAAVGAVGASERRAVAAAGAAVGASVATAFAVRRREVRGVELSAAGCSSAAGFSSAAAVLALVERVRVEEEEVEVAAVPERRRVAGLRSLLGSLVCSLLRSLVRPLLRRVLRSLLGSLVCSLLRSLVRPLLRPVLRSLVRRLLLLLRSVVSSLLAAAGRRRVVRFGFSSSVAFAAGLRRTTRGSLETRAPSLSSREDDEPLRVVRLRVDRAVRVARELVLRVGSSSAIREYQYLRCVYVVVWSSPAVARSGGARLTCILQH